MNPRWDARWGSLLLIPLAAIGLDALALSRVLGNPAAPGAAAAPAETVLLAAAVAVTLAAALLPAILAIRTTRSLKATARRWAAGDLSAGAEPPRLPGLGAAVEALNRGADALRRQETTHREREVELVGQAARLTTTARLAAGVAHELNNPLGGILLYANLVMEATPADDPRRANLQRIVTQAERAQAIVRGLLDFAHESPVEVGTLDLNALVRDTLELLERQPQLQAVQLRTELSTVPLAVEGDARRLQQVLVNVILNALDAMSEGGTLTIRTGHSERPGFCRVAVSDTGCGIPPEHLPHLFEPFFTTKEVGKGVGLGLSVSYGIVRQHGGEIEVQSQPGAGTTVRIMLPVLAEEG
ncbi:MAG TPA: ATP-binding protein [Thermoanaerobaculaceae bacterium]|nr:ATP-binding protein [Thermoanaerobaculaceae bacterium]